MYFDVFVETSSAFVPLSETHTLSLSLSSSCPGKKCTLNIFKHSIGWQTQNERILYHLQIAVALTCWTHVYSPVAVWLVVWLVHPGTQTLEPINILNSIGPPNSILYKITRKQHHKRFCHYMQFTYHHGHKCVQTFPLWNKKPTLPDHKECQLIPNLGRRRWTHPTGMVLFLKHVK